MRKLVIGGVALLVPALMALTAPSAQAAPNQIDVSVSPTSGPAGSIFTISGACGDGQNANDDWLVSISGEVDGVSLGDSIITFADADAGAFSEKAQALSDTDADVPAAGDTIDITVDCESYQGQLATGSATYDITESAACPTDLPEATGSAGDGLSGGDIPDTFDGMNFVPDAPVIVCVYSSPTLVGAANADSEGDVSISLKDPNLTGTHTYAVIGNDIDTGDQVVLTQSVDFGQPVDVPASGEAAPGSTLPDTGTPSQLRTQGLAAAALLLLGAGLVVVTRRRSDRRQDLV